MILVEIVLLSVLFVNGFHSTVSLSRSRRPTTLFIHVQQQRHEYAAHPQQHRLSQHVSITPLRSSLSSLYSSTFDDNENNKVVQISQLDKSQIVDMIEVSFIHACLQLAQGYVDILKLFIVACKAAFERRINIQDLMDQVNHQANQNTAGRALAPEEVELRSTWMQAVYLILAYIEHQDISTLAQVGTDLDQHVLSRYSSVLPTIVKFRETGKSHAAVIDLAETLAQEQELDAVHQAVTTQTMRVLWYTLVVLSEEAMADPDMPPRPNIPGTY
jgi:hypothetical protein